jgi:SAM-dependent methyltransferase
VSHNEQLQFVASVRRQHPEAFRGVKVLEMGSLDINGSVRQFFEDCDYTGVDLGEGPGVDLVCDGADLPLVLGPFDTVISCEMFEHNIRWADTWRHMFELCRPGGLMLFTCATTGRPEHGTARTSPADAPFTNNYYGNLTAEDFQQRFNFGSSFSDYKFTVNRAHRDLQFVGVKVS